MLRTILFALCAISCAPTRSAQPLTADDHARQAARYERTADSIEDECWKDRRHQLTVAGQLSAGDPTWCWRSQDVRFLEANRNAALAHRTRAAELQQAMLSQPPPQTARR